MTFAPTLLLVAAVALASPIRQGVDAWQAGDYPKAVMAWMDPAAAGDADAQFNLAQAYKLGRGVPLDMRQAEAWYRKAAAQGHKQAGAMVGLLMFQNGDRKGAMPFVRQAAEEGDPRAQYVYGTALFNGDELARDYPKAYAMMTKAAAAGLPQAQASLRQMDQFIPLADRQAGLSQAKTIRVAAATLAAPRAVRSAELPPSRASGATAAVPMPPKPRSVMSVPRPIIQTEASKPAVAKSASTGGWRVQLGAFSNAAAANRAWTTLSGKPGLKGLAPHTEKAGAVTRLQAGPFPTRAAATQSCKASGVAGCFAVGG